MKKIKIVLLILTMFLLTKYKVNALNYGGCNYTVVANLKSLINNINISYLYEIRDNDAYFSIVLNNIPQDVYFVDSITQKKYTYNDTDNGEITIGEYNNIKNGQFRFYVNNNICNGIKLGIKYYSFPIYNKRYQSEICKDISNHSLCKRWISREYSDNEFEKEINDYKNNFEEEKEEKNIVYEEDLLSKIITIYANSYYYFLPAIIIVGLITMHILKRKNRFNL